MDPKSVLWLCALSCLAIVVLGPWDSAGAQGLAASVSLSIGAPHDGHLEGASELPLTGPGFRFNPRRPPEARFGTRETVRALMRAADTVRRDLPGSELTINDIGLERGGPIAQHGSHQNGRDVDVLFYLLDAASGNPMPSVGAPLDPQGRGWDFKDLSVAADDVQVRIDLPRTWRFMRALLEDPEARVQRFFLVEHLRTALLGEARRVRAPASVVRKFDESTCQPGQPHDDHVHVRFFCTARDIRAGCRDTYPIYPWLREELRAQGVAPQMAGPMPRARRGKKLVTVAQARARAERRGPMHRRVRAFLDQREAWTVRPHPGRPYCP